nr:pentatricopeptide repeat-containing protein [Tanacetum cinerariifolium]
MLDDGNVVNTRKSSRSRNSGIVIEENVNPSFNEQDDSDSDVDSDRDINMEEMLKGNTDFESEYSDKSIDYLFEGEDELISHRKGKIEAKKLLLQECPTYYALANRFSLWFYKCSKDKVITRCGLRTEKLKVVEKGKQRKWNRISYCWPVIALDGCFLKEPNIGEILTAIEKDDSNHIYLIAWAIVNVENKDNWTWFSESLREYIDMPNRNGLTLISDQHDSLNYFQLNGQSLVNSISACTLEQEKSIY